MTHSICRWGILGSAGIARKNWQSIFRSGNGIVTAVASRSQERAQQFINECQAEVPFAIVPQAVGGYAELLERDDIDAVYIPLPTGIRKDWVIRAAQAGKHVLCEKPCADNATDLREMIAACEQAGVQFMDGVMYMHTGRLQKIREVLNDGTSLGTLRRINSQFTFNAPPEFLTDNIRMSSDLESLGCLGDLGWYTIRLTLWVMNYEMPTWVSARMLQAQGRADSPHQVPTEISAEMGFASGVTATMYNSFRTEHTQLALISGDRGSLQMNDFVLPYYGNQTSFDVMNPVYAAKGCEVVMERHTRSITTDEYSNSHVTAQESNLFRTFGQLALSRTTDPHWPEIALKTQQVMDACLESARSGKQVELA
ncbi:MAG: Gfo/Idh/MocA family oxidoreductase [Planctomycetaceae bacterium]|nr:Gfo/Idh/MocA family oxidoreductase [Planctomycetaceae bacterium]